MVLECAIRNKYNFFVFFLKTTSEPGANILCDIIDIALEKWFQG